jgi:hypothetical protein
MGAAPERKLSSSFSGDEMKLTYSTGVSGDVIWKRASLSQLTLYQQLIPKVGTWYLATVPTVPSALIQVVTLASTTISTL